MRTCPTCQKVYADDLRLCPVHQTPLVAASVEEEASLSDTLAARSVVAGGMAPTAQPLVRSSASASSPGKSSPGTRETVVGPPQGLGGGSDSLVGSQLAERYEITRKIGEGGMGVVYEAKHLKIGKRVAIKVLLEKYAQKTDIVARLEQEARLASSIGHEHIVDITDFGETGDGRTFVVMEFLEGESLAHLLAREGPLPPARAVAIVRQVAGALGAAHGKGIVHRDVKPENIFMIRRNDRDFVKVVDFGISKALKASDEPENSPRLTHTGMVLGTPLYMSPEQARGEDDLDHRIDVYAVGVILYELLTGEVPFRGTNYLNVISQVLSAEPKAPSQARPDLQISPALESIVMKAMAKDRARRYATMAELDADLGRLAAGDAVAAMSDPGLAPAQRVRRSARSIALWVVGVAVVLAATVAVVLPLTKGADAQPPTPAPAAVVQPPVAPPPQEIIQKPAPIEKVAVTVTSVPEGAEVFWGSVPKGKTPYAGEFNKNDETITLTLSLDGYEDAEVPFQPSQNQTVGPIKLKKLKKGQVKKPRPSGGGAATPGGGGNQPINGEILPNPYKRKDAGP